MFHKRFKTPGPAVLPVIHVLDADQHDRNVENSRLLVGEGAQGCFPDQS